MFSCQTEQMQLSREDLKVVEYCKITHACFPAHSHKKEKKKDKERERERDRERREDRDRSRDESERSSSKKSKDKERERERERERKSESDKGDVKVSLVLGVRCTVDVGKSIFGLIAMVTHINVK